MGRFLLVVACALAILLVSATTASAGAPASSRASCVAAITALEATQLAPGSVGREVSGLASSGPGVASASVRPLVGEHGSIEECVPAGE
jgi:hypothetical protein